MTDDGWKKFRAEPDAYDEIRDYIMARADEAGIGVKDQLRLELGIEEAIVNVINYSGSDDIWIKMTDGDGFTVEIVDRGVPFNPLEKYDARAVDTSDIEDREIGGFGIAFMRKKFSKLEYSNEQFMGERANHLTLQFVPND